LDYPRLALRGFLALLVVGVLAPAGARACQIPVFRYALERWPGSAYEAIVFTDGALPAGEAEAFKAMKRTAKGASNFEPTLVDVSGRMPEAMAKLWKAQAGAKGPWLVVRYPEADEEQELVYAGPFTAEVAKGLADSPARRELAKRILAGETTVWVSVETGKKEPDAATAKLLERELKRLEESLKLPAPAAEDDAGPKMLSELPLRIAFSVLRVSREDPAERMFVAMLLNSEKDLAKRKDQAIVVPVFGRGRALGALVGEQVEARQIAAAAEFLTGACSCQVKELNPGFDLLMSVDWEGALKLKEGNEAAEEK